MTDLVQTLNSGIKSVGGGGGSGSAIELTKIIANLDLGQVLPINADTLIQFNETQIDSLSGADLVNNRIVVPKSGIYQVNCNIIIDAQDIDSRASLALLANGAPIFVAADGVTEPAPVGNRDVTLQVTEVQRLDALAAITVQILLSTTLAGMGTVTAASLSVARLAP